MEQTIASFGGLEREVIMSGACDRLTAYPERVAVAYHAVLYRQVIRRCVIDLYAVDTIHLTRYTAAAQERVETCFRDRLTVNLNF